MDGSDKYVGRILDNRYEILELIGTGGMALVYKARCHRLNRMVAIKILKEDLAGDEEFQRRFYTESQAVAMLSHPNIVSVYDVSRSGDTEYIVMELIEGITLKQYINRKGLLNWKEALHFATLITKALSHAHSRGIIHRDIKPHNIMILKDGSVKVADFGIARLQTVQNTLTQEALGSVHYISPEQAKGGHVDARSDIYSVGVVLYEMLTSRLPFVGDSAVSVAIQHISAIPLMPRDINPDVPVGLEDITMHAMEPDLNLRFTTADEMLSDLEEFRKNPGIVFNYAYSDPSDKPSPEVMNGDTMRVVAPGTVVKIEAAQVKPDGAPVKAERPLPAKSERPLPAKTERPLPAKTERPLPAKRKAPVKPEMTGDEYRATKTRASNTSTLVGIFSIVVFLIAVLVFMWNYLLKDLFNPKERPSITIPNFVNRKYDDIVANTEYDELYIFSPRYENSDEIKAGFVISQDPTADRMREPPLPGRKIYVELVVSLGEEPPATMPYLLNKHYSEARNQLLNIDPSLDIILETIASNEVIGYVIETIPAADTEISHGNTIIIRYSGGPDIEYRTVPDYIGSRVAVLEAGFADNGIEPEFLYLDDPSEEGTVLFIERVGERVALPVTIVVHVSKGPPEPIIEMRTIPSNLVGRTMEEADATLRREGFEPDFLWLIDYSDEGTVVFVEKAGEQAEISTTVIVHVSLGPPAPIEPPETPYEPPYETPYETPATEEGHDEGYQDQQG